MGGVASSLIPFGLTEPSTVPGAEGKSQVEQVPDPETVEEDGSQQEMDKPAILGVCSERGSWKEKVEKVEAALRQASQEVLNDEEVALVCHGLHAPLLEYFGESLRADKGFFLAGVNNQGIALEYASEALRGEKELVMAALGNTASALEHASEELRGDKEVVLAALRKNGLMLRYASEDLRGDKEVVLAALEKDGVALKYASGELRGDKAVVLAALGNSGLALRYASQELRADKEVVMAVVSEDGVSLRYAARELRGDREVVLAAVINWGEAFQYATSELRNDLEFVMLVAHQSRHWGPGFYYDQAGPQVKEHITLREFLSVAGSMLAMPGQPQPAPLLQVTLTRSGTERNYFYHFHVEAMLALSGEELVCDLPAGRRGNGEPVLDDLAKLLVKKLREAGKMRAQQKHVFINFRMSLRDDLVVVTPWDHQRPLTHFLAAHDPPPHWILDEID